MPSLNKIFIILFFTLSPYACFASTKSVTLNDGGLVYHLTTDKNTVAEFLVEKTIRIGHDDQVFPDPKSEFYPSSEIIIHRAKEITLSDGNDKKTLRTYAATVDDALQENNIRLNEFDIVKPERASSLPKDGKIAITRVTIEQKTAPEPIPFEKTVKEDDALSWRTKKTEQKGEAGVKEITYEIVSHNGKEINRKVLGKKTTKEPVKEIVIQGTFVKTGKAHTGFGTWYAFRGGLFAASPWLPMGSYAKVTNKANGESVIVQINDRGPFGKNRIIDLDKVAFQKIASLGTGVIDVKVEEITN